MSKNVFNHLPGLPLSPPDPSEPLCEAARGGSLQVVNHRQQLLQQIKIAIADQLFFFDTDTPAKVLKISLKPQEPVFQFFFFSAPAPPPYAAAPRLLLLQPLLPPLSGICLKSISSSGSALLLRRLPVSSLLLSSLWPSLPVKYVQLFFPHLPLIIGIVFAHHLLTPFICTKACQRSQPVEQRHCPR